MHSVATPTADIQREARERLKRMNSLTPDEIDAEINVKAQGKFAAPTNASGVTPIDIDWLWNGFLPLGSLSLLYGGEGDGKSVLTAMLAAHATLALLPG